MTPIADAFDAQQALLAKLWPAACRGDAEAIHMVRRAVKTMRALLRLAAPQAAATAKDVRRSLRAISRVFARPRELTVMATTFDTLLCQEKSPELASTRAALDAELAAALVQSLRTLPRMLARVATPQQIVGQTAMLRFMDEPAQANAVVATALKAVRRAIRRVEDDDSPRRQHNLRKRVVTLGALLGMIHCDSDTLAPLLRSLNQLRHRLGDLQDLQMCRLWLKAHPLTAAAEKAVRRQIRQRRQATGRRISRLLRRHKTDFRALPTE